MRLKDLRLKNKLKQQDIAKYLGIKQNTYSQYENEQRQIPIPLLVALAKYYKVTVDFILELQ